MRFLRTVLAFGGRRSYQQTARSRVLGDLSIVLERAAPIRKGVDFEAAGERAASVGFLEGLDRVGVVATDRGDRAAALPAG